MSSRNNRRINRAIGKNPSLGGIPFSVVFPGAISFGLAAALRLAFGFSWLVMFLVGIWLTASWWAATGGNNFKFLSQFSRLFLPTWIRGTLKSQPVLSSDVKETNKKRVQKDRRSL
ncbi:MAG: hypothetical protein F6K31_06175 [Symploca sp. SIO2G7]|nr:hypothetical protein [Symploca sp. SIO2G7]